VSDGLDRIAGQVAGDGPPRPPVHLWHPEPCGNIDIVIAVDGRWFHEGDPIRRESLVRLFASILRREEDGEYYLVTPVEKWRLRVDFLPFVVIDFEWLDGGTEAQVLEVRDNVGRTWPVGPRYPLYVPGKDVLPAGAPDLRGIPAVGLDNGLSALFNRSAWYRLAEYVNEGEEGAYLLSSREPYILG